MYYNKVQIGRVEKMRTVRRAEDVCKAQGVVHMASMTSTGERPKSAAYQSNGAVYCPMCTHTVQATIVLSRQTARVMPGQRCPRCSASLDAGFVMEVSRAA
jgi:hypothetical protein